MNSLSNNTTFTLNNFSQLFPGLTYKIENEVYLKINYKLINKISFFLHYHTQTLYQQLIDLSLHLVKWKYKAQKKERFPPLL